MHGNVGNIWQLMRLSQPFLIFSKQPSFRLLESGQPSFLLLESDQAAELLSSVSQTAERISTKQSPNPPPSSRAEVHALKGCKRREKSRRCFHVTTVSGRGADRGDPSSSLPRLHTRTSTFYRPVFVCVRVLCVQAMRASVVVGSAAFGSGGAIW
jgi:hypothetical protein